MFTIRGRAERRSAGRKAFVTATTANSFVSYVRRKLSTSASGGVWPSTMMPALLTRTSRFSTCRAASAMLLASVTSSTRSRAPPPISSTARWPRSGSREPAYTVNPAAASCRAISLPMPLLAPVTRAVESFMVSSLPGGRPADPGTSDTWKRRWLVARQELACFLRDRRADLPPGDVGLAAGPRRRTPGLRREEVAHLASMSVEYYARIEQARGPRPSPRILDSLAGALRLTPAERTHLFRLAGTSPAPPPGPARQGRPSAAAVLPRVPGAGGAG